jgi:hypothetical protein
MRAGKKLRQLDRGATRLGLKGEGKREFRHAGLGWVPAGGPCPYPPGNGGLPYAAAMMFTVSEGRFELIWSRINMCPR